jgi:hypothetical protein
LNVWRLLAPATGPLAVLLTVLGIFVWHPGIAQAAPALSFDGSCTPDTVRPAAAALITCTISVTNTGDMPALNLAAQPSAPSAPCAIASPIYIDRTINGVAVPASGTRYNLGNLVPNAKVTSVTRLAIINQGAGLKGTKVTVFSQADPSIQASGDVCWNVDASATNPSFRMEVTKTPVNAGGCGGFLTGSASEPLAGRLRSAPSPHEGILERLLRHSESAPAPAPQGGACWPPPPKPDYGGPLPVNPPDPTPGLVDFEIVVRNLSGPAVLDISVLDVETGSGVFVQSDPPPTSTDFLGRPVWDVGTLDQGEEYRIVAGYGAQQPDRCLMAYDVAVVTSTPTGGSAENYVAFPGAGQQVGNCEGGGSSELCWHYPPDDGYPTQERCDEEVCWFHNTDGDYYYPVYEGSCDQEFCQFSPPVASGYEAFAPCDQEVCWLDFSGQGDYYEDVPCSIQYCENTAPDGSSSTRTSCNFPVCWSMPPGGEWRAIYFDCNQQNMCWYVAPGGIQDELSSCADPVCWINLYGDTYMFRVPCSETFCEYTAPDGTTTYRSYCDNDVCWSTPPEGGAWQQVGYNCQVDGYWCWYTPAGGGASALNPCDEPLCFATPPDGAIPFLYFGGDGGEAAAAAAALPIYCGFTDFCWTVPSGDVDLFIAYGLPCDYVNDFCWVTPPNGTATWPIDCGIEICWSPWPPDAGSPEDYGLPPDQLIPGGCGPGETGETGVPGTSVPLVTEDGVSAPAELSDSTISEISPEPSASTSPATFEAGTVTHIQPEPSSNVTEAEVVRPDMVDYDGDGCNNLHESGFEALTGGLRDPGNVWDFFDTPGAGNARDGSITAADIARVVQRFGRSGSAAIDPLSPPPAPPTYHTAFDRMPNGAGADGVITTQDIAVVVGQFGNTCL